MTMNRTFSRWMDRVIFIAVLFFLLSVFFASRFRNALWGMLFALPVAALFCWAVALWNRRKAGKWAVREGAKWQLHNLMLLPYREALEMAARLVAEQQGWPAPQWTGDGALCANTEEVDVEILLWQRPLDARVDSVDVLAAYHATARERLLILSTASFSPEATTFARQLRAPAVALFGPSDLLPLLEDLPREEDAYKNDKKKRRHATFEELRGHALDPGRVGRYLAYGTAMIAAYVALGIWPFLLPGLACVFLAVAARRGTKREKRLFPEDAA